MRINFTDVSSSNITLSGNTMKMSFKDIKSSEVKIIGGQELTVEGSDNTVWNVSSASSAPSSPVDGGKDGKEDDRMDELEKNISDLKDGLDAHKKDTDNKLNGLFDVVTKVKEQSSVLFDAFNRFRKGFLSGEVKPQEPQEPTETSVETEEIVEEVIETTEDVVESVYEPITTEWKHERSSSWGWIAPTTLTQCDDCLKWVNDTVSDDEYPEFKYCLDCAEEAEDRCACKKGDPCVCKDESEETLFKEDYVVNLVDNKDTKLPKSIRIIRVDGDEYVYGSPDKDREVEVGRLSIKEVEDKYYATGTLEVDAPYRGPGSLTQSLKPSVRHPFILSTEATAVRAKRGEKFNLNDTKHLINSYISAAIVVESGDEYACEDSIERMEDSPSKIRCKVLYSLRGEKKNTFESKWLQGNQLKTLNDLVKDNLDDRHFRVVAASLFHSIKSSVERAVEDVIENPFQ